MKFGTENAMLYSLAKVERGQSGISVRQETKTKWKEKKTPEDELSMETGPTYYECGNARRRTSLFSLVYATW